MSITAKSTNVAYPSFFGNFFTYLKSVELTENDVIVHFKLGKPQVYSLSTFIGFPEIKKKNLHAKVTLGNHKSTQIRLLNQKQATLLVSKLEIKLQKIIINKLKNVQKLLKTSAFDEYLRDSSIPQLAKELLPILDNYRNNQAIWHKYVDEKSLIALKLLLKSTNLDDLIISLRLNYERSSLKLRKEFYDNVESNPLTTEQRLAVIRDNDRNLILAAAGTGKTSVMVAKALDLIDREVTSPDNILILAYNKDAANELKLRYNQRLENLASKQKYKQKSPVIMTFHGLARQILTQTKLPTTLSTFALNPSEKTRWLAQWLSDEIEKDPVFIHQILNTIYVVENSELLENTQTFQTLAGYTVSTYPDYHIANYLYLNNINHEYKKKSQLKNIFSNQESHGLFCLLTVKPSSVKTSSSNIYIEFYNKSATKNQTIFHEDRAQSSTLHTINYDDSNLGSLDENIKSQLQKLITKLNKSSNKEVKKKKTRNTNRERDTKKETFMSIDSITMQMHKVGLMKRAVEGYLKCLEVIRLEQLTKEEIEFRILKQSTVKVIANIEEHINLLNQLNTAYSNELSKQNTIDFDDMITNANDAIINKIFTPTWQHILVDEFQDISSTRYKFLDCLIKNYEGQPSQKNKMERARKVKLTVVGDDWQSIYRFSGGNLELTTKFNQLVGSHTLSKLQKTFRYNNSIANVAGRFVMENIAQYKKRVTTHNTVTSSQVFLHDDLVNDNASAELTTSVKATSVKVNSVEIKVQQIINLIIKNKPQQSIAVIARYQKQLTSIKHLINKSADNLPKVIDEKERVKKPIINFWTYHGSKGLEADNTILIGFDDGAFGFPAVKKTHAIVDLLLPTLDPYPNTEERRLMYVGLTRAKNQTHLIANPKSYSVFIKELIINNYNINILSTQFKKTPADFS